MAALDSVVPVPAGWQRRSTQELHFINEASLVLNGNGGSLADFIRIARPAGKPSKRPTPYVLSVSKRRECATKIQAFVLGTFERRQFHREREAAKLLQRMWRGSLTRRHEKKRRAAWLLTTWALGRVVRLRFLRAHKAAVRLQEFWSAMRARRDYSSQHLAAQTILSQVRKRKTKLTDNVRSDAALWIQRGWRRKAVWLKMRHRRSAAIVIQKYVRRWLAWRKLSKWTRLSEKLQSEMRRKIARKRLQRKQHLQSMLCRLKRCGDSTDETARMREASLMIGSVAKMHLTLLDLRVRVAAAIQIQRVARGYLARRYVQKDVAPLAVQNFFRVRKAHETVERKRAEEYRQYLRGQFFRNERLERQRNAAATRIQASVRMHHARGVYRNRILWAVMKIYGMQRMIVAHDELKAKLRAIVKIQAAFRAYLTPTMRRRHAAARVIQSWWRGCLARFFVDHNDFQYMTRAAMVIQSAWRSRCYYGAHQEIKASAVMIQAQMRTALALQAYQQKHMAALRIQSSIARPYLAKKRVDHRRLQLLKIQAFARRILSNKNLQRRSDAACKIQSAWWMAVCRHQVWTVRPDAATRIQARVRMWRALGEGPGAIARRRRRAAVRLQAFMRTCLIKCRSKARHDAACRIQGKFCYRRFQKRWATHRWLILALQRIWRARRVRVKTAESFHQLRKVPGISRGYTWRTSKELERDRAALTIQRVMRGCLGRMRLARRHRAAAKIQAWWRAWKAMQRYKAILWAKHRLRGLVFRWRWNREMHEQLVKDMDMRTRIREHVVRIQKHERGKQNRERLEKKTAAARVIQGLLRGVLTRERTRRRHCALQCIQANVDGAHQRTMLAKRLQATVKIQAFMRGRCTRRSLLKRSCAACHIQRIERGRFCRKRVAMRKTAGHFLVRAVRTWLTAKHYRRQLQATKLIQRVWLGSSDRALMTRRHAAATKMQKIWKGIYAKRRLRRMRQAGFVLVAGAWMWRHTRLWKSKVRAATCIQAAWRGYCERLNQEHRHMCASKIAKWYRDSKTCGDIMQVVLECFVVKKALVQDFQIQHLHVIQRFARQWLRWRRGMFKTKRAVTRLQAKYRAWKAKKHVALMRRHLGRLPPQHAYKIHKRAQPQVVKIVDLKSLPPALRADLTRKVLKIQAAWRRYRWKCTICKCQGLLRAGIARRKVRRMRIAARRLVLWYRRKKLKKTKEMLASMEAT